MPSPSAITSKLSILKLAFPLSILDIKARDSPVICANSACDIFRSRLQINIFNPIRCNSSFTFVTAINGCPLFIFSFTISNFPYYYLIVWHPMVCYIIYICALYNTFMCFIGTATVFQYTICFSNRSLISYIFFTSS